MTDSKSKILARRARFLAASAASVGLVIGGTIACAEESDTPGPTACLSMSFDAVGLDTADTTLEPDSPTDAGTSDSLDSNADSEDTG